MNININLFAFSFCFIMGLLDMYQSNWGSATINFVLSALNLFIYNLLEKQKEENKS